ncbi:unnamed protein product, partial [Umbelopsis sp. WA50703]
YIKVTGGKCLSLSKGNALSIAKFPSFSKEIKLGNEFSWFHDTRSSAFWAYFGDASSIEDLGVMPAAANLQTNGKTLESGALKAIRKKIFSLVLDMLTWGILVKSLPAANRQFLYSK